MISTPPKITLAAARQNAGLTIKEAAEGIGVSVGTLHNWEKDPSGVKVYHLEKIEEVYNYPSSYILFDKPKGAGK